MSLKGVNPSGTVTLKVSAVSFFSQNDPIATPPLQTMDAKSSTSVSVANRIHRGVDAVKVP